MLVGDVWDRVSWGLLWDGDFWVFTHRPLWCEGPLWTSSQGHFTQRKRRVQEPWDRNEPECLSDDSKEVWWSWKHSAWIFACGSSGWLHPHLSYPLYSPTCSQWGHTSHGLILAHEGPFLEDGRCLWSWLWSLLKIPLQPSQNFLRQTQQSDCVLTQSSFLPCPPHHVPLSELHHRVSAWRFPLPPSVLRHSKNCRTLSQ